MSDPVRTIFPPHRAVSCHFWAWIGHLCRFLSIFRLFSYQKQPIVDCFAPFFGSSRNANLYQTPSGLLFHFRTDFDLDLPILSFFVHFPPIFGILRLSKALSRTCQTPGSFIRPMWSCLETCKPHAFWPFLIGALGHAVAPLHEGRGVKKYPLDRPQNVAVSSISLFSLDFFLIRIGSCSYLRGLRIFSFSFWCGGCDRCTLGRVTLCLFFHLIFPPFPVCCVSHLLVDVLPFCPLGDGKFFYSTLVGKNEVLFCSSQKG